MKFDLIELQTNDTIMIKMDVGNLPAQEIDAYCDKVLPKLKKTFGVCQIALLPVRGEPWDFTIIRGPAKPVKAKKQKK